MGHYELATQLVSKFTLLSLGYILVVYFTMTKLLNNHFQTLTKSRSAIIFFFIILAYTFYANGFSYTGWFKDIRRSYKLASNFPTAALVKEMLSDNINVLPDEDIILSKTEQETIKTQGLNLDFNSNYPLYKDWIYKNPLPFSINNQDQKLNVIVLFVESLSARLLPSYGAKFIGLTPSLDEFSRQSLQVKEYYNHAFPTVNGLRGQLCSIFPYFSHSYFTKLNMGYRSSTLFRCLPLILNEHGYRTYYLSYAHPNETFFSDQIKEFGFSKSYFHKQFLKRFNLGDAAERPLYGNSDKQMLSGLVKFLQENENSADKFFISLSTIGTHPGLDTLNKQNVYAPIPNPALNTIKNFDYEFGKFLAYFRNSNWSKNTIVIVTGDHVRGADVDYRKIAGNDYHNELLDQLALYISSPTHDLPKEVNAYTTSIDFAPTLLHLLGIQYANNHFIGRSFFDTRDDKLGGLGLVYNKHFIHINKTATQRENLQREGCKNNRTDQNATNCHLYRFILYTQDLIRKNKLGPALN
ncbi:MAG: LTA synthase family protein [Bdellovibrionota bacterium]